MKKEEVEKWYLQLNQAYVRYQATEEEKDSILFDEALRKINKWRRQRQAV